MNDRVRIILSLCLLGGLSGCMVGPDYERPLTPVDPNQNHRYTWLPEGWTDANDPNAMQQWWTTLGDATINELVQDVLTHNTDLRRAAANMRQAEAVLRQVHGLRWPQVGYGAQAGRSRTGMDLSFLPGGGFTSFYSNSFTHGFNVSYVLDLFGRLKRSQRAAVRDLQAIEADREALAHALVALAIDLRVQIATAQKLLRISEARIVTWERSVEVIERRYEGGLGSPVDLYLAKESLADSRAARSLSWQLIIINKHALDVMRGRPPQGREEIEDTLPALPPLDPIPLGLPSHLLSRRPDVRAAELRVAAATERIGERTAERYPDLTLGLGFGFGSNDYEKLL
ncbi:TolC family protein, partial [Planctomycetota bacterium]